MDEDDDLAFDFETNLEQQQQEQQQQQLQQQQSQTTAPAGQHAGAAPYPPPGGQGMGNYKKNYRQTVCTYWLKGLCMKGDTCGFLHQFDAARMPTCRTLLRYGVCKEPDCPYKHTLDDIKECNMYKLGFCVYGPLCRFKHTRLPGPAPAIEGLEAAKPREFRNINLVVNSVNQGMLKSDEHGRFAGRARGRYGGPWRERQQGELPGQAYSAPQLPDQAHCQQPWPMQLGPPPVGAAQPPGPAQGRPPPWPVDQQGGAEPQHRADPAVLAAAGQQSMPYGF